MTDTPSAPRPTDVLNVRALAAKREYVRGLEQRRDAEALSLLVEALCDESWYLRDLAGQAFRRIGPAAAPALLPLLDQGLWYTRTCAAAILGEMGFREAIPGLLRLTAEGNRTVMETACDALAAIAHAGGLARIGWELNRLEPEPRRACVEAIVARDRGLQPRLEAVMRDPELMRIEDPARLPDEAPLARARAAGLPRETSNRSAPPATRAPAGEPDATAG